MKRIKTVNGYTIYQAATQKDTDNYNCEIGNYNIYIAQDIRDYGLANSYPEWENEDSLAVVIARCNGSNYAVACALADELSDSTVQDMDLVLEIERRLDAGQSLETIREDLGRQLNPFYEDVQDSYQGVTCRQPEQQPVKRAPGHATYYVIGTDGDYWTKTVDFPLTADFEPMPADRRLQYFFRTVAKEIAFDDCGYYTVEEIVYDGQPCEYIGWRPGMEIAFRNIITGEIIFDECFPEWSH